MPTVPMNTHCRNLGTDEYRNYPSWIFDCFAGINPINAVGTFEQKILIWGWSAWFHV